MSPRGVKGRVDEKMVLKRHFAKKNVSNAIFTFRSAESDMRLRPTAPLAFPSGVTAGWFHENTTERRRPSHPAGAHTLPPVGRVGARSATGWGSGNADRERGCKGANRQRCRDPHPAPLPTGGRGTAGAPRRHLKLNALYTLPPVGRVGRASGRGGGRGMLVVGGRRP